nr:MAG TPA: hypothetical protein [Caudoviricetes sp.]
MISCSVAVCLSDRPVRVASARRLIAYSAPTGRRSNTRICVTSFGLCFYPRTQTISRDQCTPANSQHRKVGSFDELIDCRAAHAERSGGFCD